MVDFLRHLPREKREAIQRRIAAEGREAARLHALPDRWLANEVLRLVRGVRAAVPDCAAPGVRGYNNYLLWDVAPEIARRLGAPLLPNESSDYETRTCDAARLRELASTTYQNVGPSYLKEAARREDDLCPVGFLTREAANGNPVAIALDRACPPGPESTDFLARHVSGIAERRGHAPAPAWHPGMQGPPSPVAEPAEDPAFGPAP